MDLTLSKGKNIDLSFLVLIAVNHFDEIVLFVFLFIHQTRTHVHEFNLTSLERFHGTLHMEIVVQTEAVVFKSSEEIAD